MPLHGGGMEIFMSELDIKNIKAYEILDSRGNPTVEAHVTLENGSVGVSAVPSGASTGMHEALEMRDGDMGRFRGKGVLKAKNIIETVIKDTLIGRCAANQRRIDNALCKLDGTENKSNLGANATLAVSQAVAKAAASGRRTPLWKHIGGINSYMMPLPMMNILNGGAHADNNIEIQEFMIVPVGAKTFRCGVEMCADVYAKLRSILKENDLSTAVGDEGGFAPELDGDEEAVELLCKAIENCGYKLYKDFKIALDIASSEWYENGIYRLQKSGEMKTPGELLDFYDDLIENYPIISIEDGAAEDDFDTWEELTKRFGSKIQLVGDDLFVTNVKRIQKGIDRKLSNAVLIKPNQIGTVTETIDAVHLAREHGMGTIISHRSGETADTFIADLAVGLNAGQIKTGAPCRSERCEKYNRLMKIEDEI